ncbi:MAG: DUF3307 domain-containing protein [Rhodospirillaceae bacterium]|nr:MAG: DUF3307 domain-containing protein [Rhodospirillaceae bacterium]
MQDLHSIFLWMLIGHCLADYPLQGDFLAKAKNHRMEIGRELAFWALPAHGLIHGGAVLAATGSPLLCILEAVAHCVIDRAKCSGKITYGQDQMLHVGCKAVWLGIYAGWLR